MVVEKDWKILEMMMLLCTSEVGSKFLRFEAETWPRTG